MPLITVSRYESAEGCHYVIRRAGVNTELHGHCSCCYFKD